MNTAFSPFPQWPGEHLPAILSCLAANVGAPPPTSTSKRGCQRLPQRWARTLTASPSTAISGGQEPLRLAAWKPRGKSTGEGLAGKSDDACRAREWPARQGGLKGAQRRVGREDVAPGASSGNPSFSPTGQWDKPPSGGSLDTPRRSPTHACFFFLPHLRPPGDGGENALGWKSNAELTSHLR